MLIAAALAGCAGASRDHAGAPVRPAARAGFLTGAALRTELGNRFRAGLYRLAVMSQPGDEGADLGQPLPSGSLRSTRCVAEGPRRARSWPWSCRVVWQATSGARHVVAYRVTLRPGDCFFATARPALPQHYDSTIRSYAEHPLNQLVPLRAGC